LVQFYNPRYHCFTFPDYQLVPTLEEYAYLVGLPVLDQVPFSGLEEDPKASAIAASLCLKITDIMSNLTTKGKEKIQGLTSEFLISKAYTSAKMGNIHAFESILVLLIYGLVLFPNVDGFVDTNVIQIFLAKNPVPTLLGDTSIIGQRNRTDSSFDVHLCYIGGIPYIYLNPTLPETKPYTQTRSCH